MATDWNAYYDYSRDPALPEKWKITPLAGEKDFLLEGSFNIEKEGDYVLSYRLFSHLTLASSPRWKKIFLDGRQIDPQEGYPKTSTSYLRPNSVCNAFRFHGKEGAHRIAAEVHCPHEDAIEVMKFFLLEDLAPVAPGKKICKELSFTPEKYPEKEISFASTLSGYTPGLGCGEPTPGRFGFSKGDGVLDCAMPVLGQVDKMFLCGHPSYKKPFRWSYLLTPPGMPFHGSYAPAEVLPDDDKVEVNSLHVKWEAGYKGNTFSCTYSLATPGIITESSSNTISLSGLEYAGNYQYILLPLEEGKVKIINLSQLPEYLPQMGANFLTLFGSTEFPDLPLLLVFQKKISNVEINFDPRTSRLQSITFYNTPLMISGTIYGIKSFAPISPEDEEKMRDMAKKSFFWSRAFLAYPVKCEEYFKIYKEEKKCHIMSRFSYREISTEWGTKPLYLAPVPPAASLSGFPGGEGEYDFGFPTKFGDLKGSFGCENSYTLPLMPIERRFPLIEKGSPLPELFNEGMEAYEKFVSAVDLKFLSYPYAGSIMEPYAYASPLFHLAKAPLKEKLLETLEKRYKLAFSRENDFFYVAIRHGEFMTKEPDDEEILELYKDPTLRRYKLQTWFLRKDPFTGASYHICYLNLGLFTHGTLKTGTQEEVEQLRLPLIENDWGAGLAFYYFYLSSLATGNCSPIRENMDILKSSYSFFVKFMDWACMGTGYSDNAITFVEGANYGVFSSFIHFAKIAGDKEAENLGEYVAAKQFALRSGIMRSSQHYFCKHYDCEPWYTTKSLREESNPTQQFQNVPQELFKGRLRYDGIYNMTTEGLYAEYFDGLMQYNADEVRDIFRRYRKTLRENKLPEKIDWYFMQCVSSSLIQMSMDEELPEEEFLKELAFVKENGLLMEKFRGIHIASRRLPPKFFECQLSAWNRMKKHPLYLESWMDCQMEELLFDPETEKAVIRVKKVSGPPKVKCYFRKLPSRVLFEGKALAGEFRKGSNELLLPASGVLEIEF